MGNTVVMDWRPVHRDLQPPSSSPALDRLYSIWMDKVNHINPLLYDFNTQLLSMSYLTSKQNMNNLNVSLTCCSFIMDV